MIAVDDDTLRRHARSSRRYVSDIRRGGSSARWRAFLLGCHQRLRKRNIESGRSAGRR